MDQREVVLVTGSSGRIGTAIINRLAGQYRIVGLDQPGPPFPARPAQCIDMDIESQESVDKALNEVRERFGGRIASVIHLAGYYSFSGDPSPKYYTVNVLGTMRLLDALQEFDVEQFIFASTMLVHQSTSPGHPINEDSPLAPRWDYPQSKLQAESGVVQHHGKIPFIVMRLAGVYDHDCGVPSLANQIQLIHERKLVSHVFPGELSHGQAFVHQDDLVDAFALAIARRNRLPDALTLLIGEPTTFSYGDLQNELGRLIYGEEWKTREIPKMIAKTGAWLEEVALPKENEPFVKQWMIDLADDHYELDIGRARTTLGWVPGHSLFDTLPSMVRRLMEDPEGWYEKNKLELPRHLRRDGALGAEEEPTARDNKESKTRGEEPGEHPPRMDISEGGAMRDDQQMRIDEHLSTLWTHFVCLTLGLWLIASPFALGYLSAQESNPSAVRVMLERSLQSAETRNLLMTWSDVISGVLITIFSLLSISPKRRFPWAQWANAGVGCWLLMAPLVFWTPLPAAYGNDTIVGAFVIAFSVLVPMMPGMSMAGMMGGPDIPPGWNYCPSTWLQRLPIAALAVIGFLISRYLTAYQLGHIDQAWDPFFGDGTMQVITSETSKAWPIPDAGLGAVAYMLEILMAVMGSKQRWRTMPWMVLAFGILVVPLGGVSIFFIIIQPIVIGTWCSLCLLAALAMLVMIPYSLDELVAMGQFLLDAKRKGKPLWSTFWKGDAMEGGEKDNSQAFRGSLRSMIADMSAGVTFPWALATSAALGLSLMFTRLSFGTSGTLANVDHLVGALVITVSVIAFAEVARPVRFFNVLLGLWVIGAHWWHNDGSSDAAMWNATIVGALIILLSFPKGSVKQSYAGWNRYIL